MTRARLPFYLPLSVVALALAWMLALGGPVHAQQTAKVLASCGTAGYTAQTTNYVTMDTTGAACGSSGGGGGGNVVVTSGNLTASTHGQCATLCSNAVLKGAAGTLYSFEVQADATLAGAAWYVMIFDAATLPADGTVTPAKCYAQTSGTTQMGGTLGAGGSAFATGVVIGVSTTGCYTKTASVHAYIGGDFQ